MCGNCDCLIYAIVILPAEPAAPPNAKAPTPSTPPPPAGKPRKPGLEEEIMRTLEAFPEAKAAVYATIDRFMDEP